MEIEEARRITDLFFAQQEARARLREQLASEYEAYEELSTTPGLDEGWRVMRDPLHRLEEKNHHIANAVRASAQEMPLTNRLVEYKGSIWWLTRPVWFLTDEEIDSDSQYRRLFDAAVACGDCPGRNKA